MNTDETSRFGKYWWLWAMIEHTRLQLNCNWLWESLDTFMLADESDSFYDLYERECDKLDALETSPICLFLKHDWEIIKDDHGNRKMNCKTGGPHTRQEEA